MTELFFIAKGQGHRGQISEFFVIAVYLRDFLPRGTNIHPYSGVNAPYSGEFYPIFGMEIQFTQIVNRIYLHNMAHAMAPCYHYLLIQLCFWIVIRYLSKLSRSRLKNP